MQSELLTALLTLQSPVVTTRTTSSTFSNPTFCPHSVFMCFVWISEQTAIISLYNISWLYFTTETECVYCVIRTGSLYMINVNPSVQYIRLSPSHNATTNTCFQSQNRPSATLSNSCNRIVCSMVTWLALQSFLLMSWFFSVPPGKCWNSTSNYVTTASFHILSSLPTTTASPDTQPAHQSHQQHFMVSCTPRLSAGWAGQVQCDRRRGSSVRSDLTIEKYWVDPQDMQQMFSKASTASCLFNGYGGHEAGQPSPTSARVKNEKVHLHASIHLQSEHFYTRNHVRAT